MRSLRIARRFLAPQRSAWRPLSANTFPDEETECRYWLWAPWRSMPLKRRTEKWSERWEAQRVISRWRRAISLLFEWSQLSEMISAQKTKLSFMAVTSTWPASNMQLEKHFS